MPVIMSRKKSLNYQRCQVAPAHFSYPKLSKRYVGTIDASRSRSIKMGFIPNQADISPLLQNQNNRQNLFYLPIQTCLEKLHKNVVQD